jgi:hypothetical protein
MVASQMARLKSGAVTADKFDFVALKFDGARWGAQALGELSRTQDGPDGSVIATRAAQAVVTTNRFIANQANITNVTPATMAEHVEVYPAGRDLPDGFLDSNFGIDAKTILPPCIRGIGLKCVARFVTLAPDRSEAILFLDGVSGSLFESDAQGKWRQTARLDSSIYCQAAHNALKMGDFQIEPHVLPDVVSAGQHLSFIPLSPQPCPPS